MERSHPGTSKSCLRNGGEEQRFMGPEVGEEQGLMRAAVGKSKGLWVPRSEVLLLLSSSISGDGLYCGAAMLRRCLHIGVVHSAKEQLHPPV